MLIPFPIPACLVRGFVDGMAVSGSELSSLSVPSYIRGYHAYQDVWSPFTGEVLPFEREPDNPEDVHAVAIKRAGRIVGHVPFNLAPTVSAFLRRSRNKCLVEVRGSKVNRGGGYGLEIPCEYHFIGPKDYIDKLDKICKNLQSKELL